MCRSSEMNPTGEADLHLGGLADSRGSVAVETALVIPVLLLSLYAAADIGYYLLAHAAVHRATASFAELVVNETPVEPDRNDATDSDSAAYNAIRESHATDTGRSWLRLVDLMIDNDGDTTGIAVVARYCIASDAGNAFGDFAPLQAGNVANTCPSGAAVTCGTELEDTNLAYLRVRICYLYQPPVPTLSRFVLPERIESRFLALRKDVRL